MMMITLYLTSVYHAPVFSLEKQSEQIILDTVSYKTYHGLVKDEDSNSALLFANVALKGTNIATVSNGDGVFTIKVPDKANATQLEISHIGYTSQSVDLSEFNDGVHVVRLKMAAIPLKQVNIYPDDAELLVRNMMHHVDKNYLGDPTMMKAFYRESIKRNRSHVAIAEAVVDIHKASYTNMQNDQVKVFKGRKSEDVAKMDTLVFRLKGGPAIAILMDVIKVPYSLLSEEDFENYTYDIVGVIEVDGRPHFVVSFKQKPGGEFPLYNGKFYIEANTLALSSAEFSLNLQDPDAAAKLLIQKKPAGLKVTPKQVTYLVNYREQDGKWYFNYARGEMELKMRWNRKLFNTTYTALMEMAITDRDDRNVTRFKGSERFKQNQILTDKVSDFADPEFWGEHNTIEPDESIQSAIDKLKRKGKF